MTIVRRPLTIVNRSFLIDGAVVHPLSRVFAVPGRFYPLRAVELCVARCLSEMDLPVGSGWVWLYQAFLSLHLAFSAAFWVRWS